MKFYHLLIVLLILQIFVMLPPIKLYNDSLPQIYHDPEAADLYRNTVLLRATEGGIGPAFFLRQDAIGSPTSGSEIIWSFYYTAVYLGNIVLDLVLFLMVVLAYKIENNSLTILSIRQY
jgi:hypothetical protein